ncbi:hypothetical protein AAOE16_13690 [Ekhidna sp. MALMAid0563]|uniref:hypothetical protein n=1 Tax=Ekhidna sp. MALMAid0563 TaxID=3143937 RepID=UPI0032DEA7C3
MIIIGRHIKPFGYLFLALNALFISCSNKEKSETNILSEPYLLDGSISVFEKNDTIFYDLLYEGHFLLIKENQEHFYIGVHSDIKTIMNVYHLGDDQIKIMHASASLGEINFDRNTSNEWVRDRDKWDWRYRDKQVWTNYHGEDYLHQDPIRDFETFYSTFGWVGSTVSFGSQREMEMVISKEKVHDLDQLVVSLDIRFDEDSTHVYSWPFLLTDDSLEVFKIHQGGIPLLPKVLATDYFNIPVK